MVDSLIKQVKQVGYEPYLLAALFVRAGPRVPGRIVKSDLRNSQPFLSSKVENCTLPALAKTLKRLEVIPKSAEASFAEINWPSISAIR